MLGILTLCFFLAIRMASSKSAVIERLGDRYEILQPIGQPFGQQQQLLARDRQQQRSVVIKSLTVEENTLPEDISCFEREIHLLKSLNHPAIPRYLDSFTVNTPGGKGLVLVQTHAGGQTLSEQISGGQIYSQAAIKAIAKQLLQSLVYLHEQGLVHRDIKPENITLVTRNLSPGQACWLNLGTVQYVQVQRPDTLVGTYGYMPPEQVGGQATFSSDLYSLGATLIYLATGCHLGELPGQRLRVEFACAATRLSPHMQQWLNWLIKPSISDRPVSAQQALSALNRLPLAMSKQRLQRLWHTPKTQGPVPIVPSAQAQSQPFFTQIKSAKKSRSFELVIPPAGLRSGYFKRALPPLLVGGAMLVLAIYLMALLNFSSAMFTSASGLTTLAAACLGIVGCVYSLRFLKRGLVLLGNALLRQIYIQLEADVLLIAYKYWWRSPVYIVNTKRADIYSISSFPDGGALRILTHQNRTRARYGCYRLRRQRWGAQPPRYPLAHLPAQRLAASAR